MACAQCGVAVDELGEGVMTGRWEEQWSTAPILVRIAVGCSWSISRLAARASLLGSPSRLARPAFIDTVIGASVRVARFEVASRMSEIRSG